MTELESLSKKVDKQLERSSASPEVKEWALTQLQAVQEEYDLLASGDYEEFILSYLSVQVEEFRSGERVDPICTCRDSDCPLKHGRMPREVRRLGSLTDGVRAFSQRHRGTPLVLEEAREDYLSKRSIVIGTLRRVLAGLTSDTTITKNASQTTQ